MKPFSSLPYTRYLAGALPTGLALHVNVPMPVPASCLIAKSMGYAGPWAVKLQVSLHGPQTPLESFAFTCQ